MSDYATKKDRTALIGYTGFVGSNLSQQHNFTDLYNSKNILEMQGQAFDLVVCAGVSAVKWLANKNPEEDLANIKLLEKILTTISAKKVILISTIDVYPIAQNADEGFDFSNMENHAYGKHRLAFEKFCNEKFSNCTIVRLPGLFGKGLKKNVIYDLLNDNCLEMINVKSSFQYYYLKYLWADIQKALESDIKVINLFTEPVSTREIITTFFPFKKVGQKASAPGDYDLYTKYAKYWGNSDHYIYDKKVMISQLSEFIMEYRAL
jgi:nucleoside-diphosphate-sugar epimerase